ncbi:hypothetical protein CISG_09269 [Coccidioides immitis RMSCC 3703]|uniref:Uncharacterized protein n=2 Tax=Coccidioides immitis TaxID=5501 RepID=A0A0J8U546_COCIT|nr:hypothetical protein CIRG_06831 [Coccidioides immitis RMSCC 2394]KMU82042.1 hypothetical protein CISG_09269 [Coccidioides immitis RMSCC 3703]
MLPKKLYNHSKQGPCTSYYCSYKVVENSKFHAEIINTARSKYAVRIAICLTQVTDTGGNKEVTILSTGSGWERVGCTRFGRVYEEDPLKPGQFKANQVLHASLCRRKIDRLA